MTSTHNFSSTKPTTIIARQQALKALNAETATETKALNQAQSAIAHALRVIEADYQRKRTHIINSADEQPAQTEPRT